MKKNILLMALSIAIFAVGCASHTKPICSELDKDGSFFLIANYKYALENFNDSMNTLSDSILNSSLNSTVKNEIAAKVLLYTLICPLAGIEEDFTVGASSIELPQKLNKNTLFRNSLVLKADSIKNNQGLWQLLGPNRNLSTPIAKLPASAIFAMNMELEPKVIANFLNLLTQTLDDELFFDETTTKALENIQGEFAITVLPLPPASEDSKKYPWGVAIAIDDSGKYVYKAIANFFGYPSVGNELFMKNFVKEISRENPMVLLHKDNKTLLFSSKEARMLFEQNATLLGDDKNYDKLMQELPTSGNGFVLIKPQFQNFYSTMLRFLKINTLSAPMPLAMMVMQKNSTIKFTANSTWDINSSYIQFLLNKFREKLTQDIAQKHQQFLMVKNQHKAIDSCLDTLDKISKLLKNKNNQNRAEIEDKIREIIAQNSEHKFVFFGLPTPEDDPNLPVVVDAITNHNNFFNVVLNSGKIDTFSVTKLDSYKRLISFLHTHFKYKERDFMGLIKKASEIDNEN